MTARNRGGGNGSGEPAVPPSGVAIVGTPMSFPVSGAHSANDSAACNHPGGTNTGIAVIVSTRPTAGGLQATTITWGGVTVPIIVNSSVAGMQANDAFVAIGVLPAAAAGAQPLATVFPATSDSVVTIMSLERLNQVGPTGAVNSAIEHTTPGNPIAAGITTTAAGSLALAAAAISYGTTTAWAAPFTELFDTASDVGVSTSTTTLSGATSAPANGVAVTATATFTDADDGRSIAVVELLAA